MTDADPLRPTRLSAEDLAPGTFFLEAFVPYEARWSGPEDGPMPRQDGVPLLNHIVPERWVEVVSGLSSGGRRRLLTHNPMPPAEAERILDLVGALPPAPDVIARRAIASGGASVPIGVVVRPEYRRTRQLSVRIGRDEHELLVAAAHIAGTTPTTLSRMLILGGMRKILAEHGRYYGVAAPPQDED